MAGITYACMPLSSNAPYNPEMSISASAPCHKPTRSSGPGGAGAWGRGALFGGQDRTGLFSDISSCNIGAYPQGGHRSRPPSRETDRLVPQEWEEFAQQVLRCFASGMGVEVVYISQLGRVAALAYTERSRRGSEAFKQVLGGRGEGRSMARQLVYADIEAWDDQGDEGYCRHHGHYAAPRSAAVADTRRAGAGGRVGSVRDLPPDSSCAHGREALTRAADARDVDPATVAELSPKRCAAPPAGGTCSIPVTKQRYVVEGDPSLSFFI